MKPGTFGLDLYRGDSYHWQFVLWADAAKTIAIDLSTATVKAEIRDKPGSTNITALACSTTLPNTINADLSAAACAGLPEKGKWDLQLTYANGDVGTVLAGPVTVAADVTDSGTAGTAKGAQR